MAEVLAVSMAGGTIRSHRKLIHRESSRVSVLNLSGHHAVLHSIAVKKCLLTEPSLLSRATPELLTHSFLMIPIECPTRPNALRLRIYLPPA